MLLAFLENKIQRLQKKKIQTLTTYKMQVKNLIKNWLWLDLAICMVLNAYFLPCCNGCIIWKFGDIVKNLGEHACGHTNQGAWLVDYATYFSWKLNCQRSFHPKPNTITIVISTTFMYSLGLKAKRGKYWIFNHIWIIKFTFVDFCIIFSTLWLMVNWKWKVCTSSRLKSRSPKTANPPLNFLSTNNENLISSRWGKKLLEIIFSHVTNTMITLCQKLSWFLHEETYETTQNTSLKQPPSMQPSLSQTW